MRVLIAGWFSFEQMGATAGDLISKDIVACWLQDAQIEFDVALASPFEGGVKWQEADPSFYSHIVFVCGPFGNGWPISEFLERFDGKKILGLNLSMLEDLEKWNPFDFLAERDSSRKTNPDLVFLSAKKKIPLVGLILVEPQKEYGEKAKHEEVREIIMKLLSKKKCAVVLIDTRLDVPNKGGLSSPEAIESVISRMDLVVTTRLHGMVMAIKNGVPALVVDAIKGGAKLKKQASNIGYNNIFVAGKFDVESLEKGYEYCLTEKARKHVQECYVAAKQKLKTVKRHFFHYMRLAK